MRKMNFVVAISLLFTLFAGVALTQVSGVSAQADSPVGVVVAYIPGISITIVDQHGNQVEYALDASLKIEPSDKADSLKVGSLVTIIAPASVDQTKKVAVGIVVHPEKELMPSETPRVKDTPLPTNVPPTAITKVSETPTPVESVTATTTPFGTVTMTPPPPEPTKTGGTTVTIDTNTFIEWLRSLFVQVLSRQ